MLLGKTIRKSFCTIRFCCQTFWGIERDSYFIAQCKVSSIAQMTVIGDSVHSYVRKVRLFQHNTRLYLLYLIISGVAFGVYALLFNFYILSLEYDEARLGRLRYRS